MMAISKKKSMAARLMLVVAVVAGTCASGADAAFDISNLCDKTINMYTGASNVSIGSGATLNITQPPASFFSDFLNITIIAATNCPLVSSRVPPNIVSFLNSLVGLTSIAISSDGFCVTLTVTFTVFTPMTVPFGPFCLHTLLH